MNNYTFRIHKTINVQGIRYLAQKFIDGLLEFFHVSLTFRIFCSEILPLALDIKRVGFITCWPVCTHENG